MVIAVSQEGFEKGCKRKSKNQEKDKKQND